MWNYRRLCNVFKWWTKRRKRDNFSIPQSTQFTGIIKISEKCYIFNEVIQVYLNNFYLDNSYVEKRKICSWSRAVAKISDKLFIPQTCAFVPISFEPFIRTFARIAANSVRTSSIGWTRVAAVRTFVNICKNVWVYKSKVTVCKFSFSS